MLSVRFFFQTLMTFSSLVSFSSLYLYSIFKLRLFSAVFFFCRTLSTTFIQPNTITKIMKETKSQTYKNICIRTRPSKKRIIIWHMIIFAIEWTFYCDYYHPRPRFNAKCFHYSVCIWVNSLLIDLQKYLPLFAVYVQKCIWPLANMRIENDMSVRLRSNMQKKIILYVLI